MTTTNRGRLADGGRGIRNVPRPNLIERRMSKFLRAPPSIRVAAGVIVTATAIVVVGGGILIRILDHREYSNVWVGMWWALQTVTTVGYGDVTPARPIGRAVGAFVMLEGIAFLAIITAAITSTFVARAARERALVEGADEAAFEARVEERLDEFGRRFDELQSTLRDLDRR
ncbi:MAG: potassium channel family protein [Gaiellaceae bacterium]|jgi:voltage-gated potassium channel